MRNFLKSLVAKVSLAATKAAAAARNILSPEVKAVQHLPLAEQGKLENRFHYARPLGGFRLRPSGKHHRGHAPYHGKPRSRLGAVSIA